MPLEYRLSPKKRRVKAKGSRLDLSLFVTQVNEGATDSEQEQRKSIIRSTLHLVASKCTDPNVVF